MLSKAHHNKAAEAALGLTGAVRCEALQERFGLLAVGCVNALGSPP